MYTSELRNMTCCFTGHRNLPMHKRQEIANQTAAEIRTLITANGVRFFGVGGAIGYDTLAADVLFQLRKQDFPHIKIILVYPFDGFTSQWTQIQKAHFKRQLSQYDKIVCISNKADRESYLARDRHLVDGSAYCICYSRREPNSIAARRAFSALFPVFSSACVSTLSSKNRQNPSKILRRTVHAVFVEALFCSARQRW